MLVPFIDCFHCHALIYFNTSKGLMHSSSFILDVPKRNATNGWLPCQNKKANIPPKVKPYFN